MVSVPRLAAIHGAFWVADRWYRIWWYVWPASLALLISGWIFVDKPGPGGAQDSAAAAPWGKAATNAPPIPGKFLPVLANWPEKLQGDVMACFAVTNDVNNPPVDACTRLIDSGEIANPQRFSAYNERGWLLRVRQPDRALDDFETALKIVPDAPVALSNRGFIYMTKNRFDAALDDLNKAIEKFPPAASGRARMFRGLVYMRMKDYDKAMADLNEAQRLDPNSPDPYVARGEAEQAQQSNDAALRDFDEVSKHAPRDVRGLIGRANVLEATGHRDEALAALDGALGIDPANARAMALRDRLRTQQWGVGQLKKESDPPK